MNGGFRWGDIGVICAVLANVIIGTWEVAHLDGRQTSLERSLDKDEVVIGELTKADIEKSSHLTKLDDIVDVMRSNIQSILEAVSRIESNTSPGDANTQPNFTRHK